MQQSDNQYQTAVVSTDDASVISTAVGNGFTPAEIQNFAASSETARLAFLLQLLAIQIRQHPG